MGEHGVKSAERALEILEFVSSVWHDGKRAKDICSSLDLPQSSCSILLNNLVRLGYLYFDPLDKTYSATFRTGCLGLLSPAQFSAFKVATDHLNHLCAVTEELCFIAQRNGPNLQYIMFQAHDNLNGSLPRVGLQRPLTQAASGKVLLTFMKRDEVVGILRRNNYSSDGNCNISSDSLLSELDAVRSQGFASSDPKFTPGLIGYATWLVSEGGGMPYAIGTAISTRNDARKRELVKHELSMLASTSLHSCAAAPSSK